MRVAASVCGLVLPLAAYATEAGAASATTAPAVAPATGTPARVSRTPRGSGLDERVALLAAELNLDAGQQAEVRKLLESQREQVRQVWSNSSIPAGSRVGATRAISGRTADQIRALLNDDQKKKYLAARQPHSPADQSAMPGLDYWMDRSKH